MGGECRAGRRSYGAIIDRSPTVRKPPPSRIGIASGSFRNMSNEAGRRRILPVHKVVTKTTSSTGLPGTVSRGGQYRKPDASNIGDRQAPITPCSDVQRRPIHIGRAASRLSGRHSMRIKLGDLLSLSYGSAMKRPVSGATERLASGQGHASIYITGFHSL